ncbi:cholesterol esterase [Streptomyces kurssanovii]|nr:cholesterol esterase [Streptomyces kurssanovii]
MESMARGGTRWKRFALVMVPSVAATAAIGVGLAQGALAASFAVSGQEFKVTAGKLVGTGFSQYGGVDMGYKDLKGDEKVAHPVAISTFKNASITKMCQSVVTDVPFVGKITLKLTAGDKGTDVKAEKLYLDVSELDADAKFRNIDIGVAAKDTDNPGVGKGPAVKDTSILPNGFAQQAEEVELTGVEQKAWATTAGTFELSGLSMRLHKGDGPKVECY